MVRVFPSFLVIAFCALVTGCDHSPTTPSPGSPARYDGQWSGATFQRMTIAFSVSSDQKVTAISVGYRFDNCAGEKTFTNLNQDIGYASTPPIGSPRGPSTARDPAFYYASAPFTQPDHTQIYGSFTSSTTANGYVVFGDHPGCGSAGGIWNAVKR